MMRESWGKVGGPGSIFFFWESHQDITDEQQGGCYGYF